MANKKPAVTPWDLTLRATIKTRLDAGDRISAIARGCGLSHTSLWTYYQGERGLSGAAQYQLANYLGFTLKAPRLNVASAEASELG